MVGGTLCFLVFVFWMIFSSVADPEPGSGNRCFFGLGILIREPRWKKSYFLELSINFLWVKNTLIFLCRSGPGISSTLDPGWKKVGSGINIPDPHHWFLAVFTDFWKKPGGFLVEKRRLPNLFLNLNSKYRYAPKHTYQSKSTSDVVSPRADLKVINS